MHKHCVSIFHLGLKLLVVSFPPFFYFFDNLDCVMPRSVRLEVVDDNCVTVEDKWEIVEDN